MGGVNPTKAQLEAMPTKRLLGLLKSARLVEFRPVYAYDETPSEKAERHASEAFREDLRVVLATREHLVRKAGNFGEVTLTPMGSKIKYRISGRVHCQKMRKDVRNSGTYSVRDGVWKAVFGTKDAMNRFIKANRPIVRTMDISKLGYDFCDVVT